MIRVTRLLVVVATVGLLAGCSATSGYADLERAATADDVLPAALPPYASEEFVEGSVRHVGDHDEVQYFLARTVPPGVCVVAYRSAEAWITACGDVRGVVTSSGAGVTVVVAPDDLIGEQRGTPVGANVVVVN